jgi:BioD-like phosphotransacetylase family protein
VIISEGGVGRPIDEIVLNAALFAAHGVEVAGAIVNKVDLVAQPGIARTLERGLASHGIPLLAILPLRPILSNPTLEMIQEGVSGDLLSAGAEPGQVIDGVAIGAMEPGEMRRRLGRATLVLVPGDREETILSLTGARLPGGKRRRGADRPPATHREARAAAREVFASPVIDESTRREAAGLVLTGGTRPRDEVVDAIRAAGLFATVVPEDTYTVASEIHDLLVKTHATNREKIALIKSLVAENIDVERILEVARPAFASA